MDKVAVFTRIKKVKERWAVLIDIDGTAGTKEDWFDEYPEGFHAMFWAEDRVHAVTLLNIINSAFHIKHGGEEEWDEHIN